VADNGHPAVFHAVSQRGRRLGVEVVGRLVHQERVRPGVRHGRGRDPIFRGGRPGSGRLGQRGEQSAHRKR
jgi:hypothetical protein